jgi:glycosyltransferase involved in cell wall biosynthesis
MRILIVVHQFMPRHHAGTEMIARDTGLELLRRGHEVHVLAGDLGSARDGGRITARRYDHRGLAVQAVELPLATSNVDALEGEYGREAVAEHVREYVEALRPNVIHIFHLAHLGARVVDVLVAQGVPVVYTATDFWSICTRSILMKPSGERCTGPDDISSNCLECRWAERLVPRNVPAARDRRRRMYRRLAEGALAERVGEHPAMAGIRSMLGRTEFVRERINSVDAILAPTLVVADMLTANGIRPELVRHSPYGIEVEPLLAVRERRRPSPTLRLGYMGSLRHPKGVEVLVDAFQRLPANADATLRIVGSLQESPVYARGLYERAAGDPRINFTGPIANERTIEQLAEIDVLAVPSLWYENSPTTILAGLAAGVPAIASNLGGIAEIVRDGENGLLFETGEPDELAARIGSLLDQPGLLENLRENADPPRSVDDSVDEVLAIYDAIAKEGRMPRAGEREGERGMPRAPGDGDRRSALAESPRLRAIRRRARARRPRVGAVAREGAGGGSPPFLLTGRARSGTSWLMRILDAHPEILCRGEGRFFGARFRAGDTDVRSLHGALLASKPIRAWAQTSGWTRHREVREQLAEMASLLSEGLLRRELERSGKRIVGDKTPLTTTSMLREVAELQPGTRVIQLIRDGRDVAVSSVHHVWNSDVSEGGFHELDPEQRRLRAAYRADPAGFVASGTSIFRDGMLASTARDWARLVRSAMRQGPQCFGDDYIEVRYEDLLERGPEEIRRLLSFLDVEASPRTASRCLRAARFERSSHGRKRGTEDSLSPARIGMAGDWSRVFTAEDRRIFKEAAGDLLIELGYERDHDW